MSPTTMRPTSAPSADPTIEPTPRPTAEPTAVTGEPSFAPTNAPSKAPTNAPTASPSAAPTPICHGASYKESMSSWGDSLWAGESLVSSNCQYLLTMESSGNLVMYGLADEYNDPCLDGAAEGCRRRRLTDNEWLFGWNTGTELASNRSVAEFTVESDGTLSIWEYPVADELHLASVILIWSVSTGVTQQVSRSLLLTLSDEGCLELGGEGSWSLCSTYSSNPNGYNVSGSAVDTIYPDAMNTDDEDSADRWPWWPVVALLLFLFFLCCICICWRKWHSASKDDDEEDGGVCICWRKWRSASQEDDEEDDAAEIVEKPSHAVVGTATSAAFSDYASSAEMATLNGSAEANGDFEQ